MKIGENFPFQSYFIIQIFFICRIKINYTIKTHEFSRATKGETINVGRNVYKFYSYILYGGTTKEAEGFYKSPCIFPSENTYRSICSPLRREERGNEKTSPTSWFIFNQKNELLFIFIQKMFAVKSRLNKDESRPKIEIDGPWIFWKVCLVLKIMLRPAFLKKKINSVTNHNYSDDSLTAAATMFSLTQKKIRETRGI